MSKKIKNADVLALAAKDVGMTAKRLDAALDAYFRHIVREGYKNLMQQRKDTPVTDPRDIAYSATISNRGVGSFYIYCQKGMGLADGTEVVNELGGLEKYQYFHLQFSDHKKVVDQIIAEVDEELLASEK
ncbi:MAG: hypothetical protein U5L45_00295 [Saprospiraceae bacterium]|nr:hypothetical protein [Saprospiraceae bacterium]